MTREQHFKDQLRLAGERLTRPRIAVFQVLIRYAPLPMSALINQAQSEGMDGVTVYRTVDLFRKLGLIQEVGLGRNRLLELNDGYDLHHHHIMCMECGRITDFDSGIIEADLARLATNLGFEIRSHQLEATGVCAACQAKLRRP